MGYISPQKAFAHIDRLADWQRGLNPAPVTVEIDTSNKCSLGCQSCHFAHTHVAGPWAMRHKDRPFGYTSTGSFADVEMLFPALADMAEAGVQGIVWSGGGEPTLHPDFAALISFAAACGLKQGVYTLGGHITDEIQAAAKSLSWAVVSLDCADAETYALEKGVPASRFDAACQGVTKLARTCPVVGVSFLLHAGNWTRTPEMLALARTLGATYATFRPTIETSPANPAQPLGDRSWITDALPDLRALDLLDDVEVDPDRFAEWRDWTGRSYSTCYGIRLVTMVTPDGRVWVCPNRRGVPGSELGNLTTESFKDIWLRHPRQWTKFGDCRAMCRLNLVNQTVAAIYEPREHEAFV